MEKTKHLSMTSEEKQARKTEEIESALKGLVQKFQDRVLKPALFQKELKALHEQYDFEDREILLNEIFSRFDLEADNTFLLELIKDVIHLDTATYEKLLEQYRGEMMAAVRAGVEEKKDELRNKYLISGAAVIPNTVTDPSVQRVIDDIKNRFQSALDKVKPYP